MSAAGNYGRIESLDQLKRLTDKLLEVGDPIGFDVETGYLGPDREKGSLDWSWEQQFIAGFSFTNDKRWARYVPVAHDLSDNLPEEQTWEVMKPVLETLPVVAHHFKFEAHNLRMLEMKGRGPRIEPKFGGDTMLQGYVIQGCDLPTPHSHSAGGGSEPRAEFRSFGLKDMVLNASGHKMMDITELFVGYTAKQLRCLRFNVLELTPEVIAYGCEDAAWTIFLNELVERQALEERKNMLKIEYEISQVMTDVEEFGMHVDWQAMELERQKAIPFGVRMEKSVKAGLGALAGRDLTAMNLGSTKQLKELIYRDLGFETTRLTAGAQNAKNAGKAQWELMSTDAVAMEGLAKEHPALKKMLEWREVGNALNRFDKYLDEHRFSWDRRIHPSFAQTVVGTGRFAANDPPVQQMPKEWRWSTCHGLDVWGNYGADWEAFIAREDTEPHVDYWTGNFRDYVTAAPGCYLLGYDYSQIELRVLAGVSQEPLLMDAFKNGIDVHTLTAAMMLGKSVEEVDPKVDRPKGKTMNFALLYQMGVKSMAERLAVTQEEAQKLYNAYFAQFASVTTWMQKARTQGELRGYAETPFGRKYTVWELLSDNKQIRAKADRVFINAPIQGGAADYMKMAMIRARRALIEAELWGTHVRMIHNLHDALTFEASNEVHPEELREILARAVVFPVRNFPEIVADWELGMKHGSCKAWRPEKGEHPVFDGEHWRIVKGDQEVAKTYVSGVSAAQGSAGYSTKVVAEEESAGHATTAPSPAEGDQEALTHCEHCPAGCTREHSEACGGDECGAAELQQGVDLRVEIALMPTENQLRRLVDLVVNRPGPNTLVLATPEGEVRCSAGTSIDVGDQGTLSLILGGATVKHAKSTIDLGALAAGL